MPAPHIDPRRPRPSSDSARRRRAQLLARQLRADARRNRLRLLVHGSLIAIGLKGVAMTDLDSPDRFLSVTLPLLDAVFCVYLLLLLFIEVFRGAHR